jgi:carboxyl-terminal processing protease
MRARLLSPLLPPSLALALLLVGVAPARAELGCGQIPDLVRAFLRHHVSQSTLDPELERRTIETYLRRLDSTRTLLTEPERAALESSLTGVFEQIGKGNCTRLLDLHKEFARHHEHAAKFVRLVVEDPDYAIDPKAKLVLDPDERGNPATAAERDDLLRRWVHFQMSTYVANGTELEEARRKLAERYDRRFRRFLEIGPDDVYSGFVDAFAVSLDPHSNYLSADVLEDFRIGMSLSLEGIGVALSEEDGYAVAERIIPGGAADRQGTLRTKDKIIAVAQEEGEFVDIIDMPLREAVSLIRGKKGTRVGLTVLREAGERPQRFNIAIVRDTIDLEEQAASLRYIERKAGDRVLKLAVLELPSFYGDSDPGKRQSSSDVAKLLREADEAGVDGLLLDLSRNGGGLLQHAVTISGYFLREGAIVAIENARGQRQIQRDVDSRTYYAGPLVVLTSRVSASASEILAGALKDYQRAVIVGDDHTFGKGTVQTVSPLPHGEGALKITTQLFFRPGGRSTQHDGVLADVVIPSLLAGDDSGEQHQRYSLGTQTTTAFLSPSANDDDRRGHWQPVDDKLVAELVRRSRERVAQNEAFAEIRAQIEERKSRDGEIRVEEFLAERAEAREEQASEEEAEEDPDELSPQAEEALLVLRDLVSMSGSAVAATGASQPGS